MELLAGFVLGILASAIAAVVLEYGVRPLLGIVVDDSGRAQGQVVDQPRHEFYHVTVRNLPARRPLPGRRPAWSCNCSPEVFTDTGEPCLPAPILARWTSQPEPVFPIADHGRVAHIPDFAKIIAGRKVDVHKHDDQQLSVAVKLDGERALYLFTNESYLFPRWQNPAWRPEIGTYRLRVTAYYERGRAVTEFELANRGTSLDDVQIRPWAAGPLPAPRGRILSGSGDSHSQARPVAASEDTLRECFIQASENARACCAHRMLRTSSS